MESVIEKEWMREDGKWYVRIRCKTGEVYEFEFEGDMWEQAKKKREGV